MLIKYPQREGITFQPLIVDNVDNLLPQKMFAYFQNVSGSHSY